MSNTVTCCFCDRPIVRGGRNCNSAYPVRRKSDFCCERCYNVIVYTMQRYLDDFVETSDDISDYDKLHGDKQAQRLAKSLTLACRRIFNMEKRISELKTAGKRPDAAQETVTCCFCERPIAKNDGNSTWPIHDGSELCCGFCNEIIVKCIRDRVHGGNGQTAHDRFLDDVSLQRLCDLMRYSCHRMYLLESTQRSRSW